MATATLDRPTLNPAHPRLRPHDRLVVHVEVVTATADAWLVRLAGGSRKAWLAFSLAREIEVRGLPAGLRAFAVPKWKHEQLRLALTETE